MVSFRYEEPEPPNPAKGCKSLGASLKDAFSGCNSCRSRLSISSSEQNYPASDADDDEEEVVVSEIRSRAMEKLKQKPLIITDGFSWAFSPKTGELFLNPKAIQQEDGNKDDDNNDDGKGERQEFYSVASCFSCSSALSRDAFVSVKTSFSRCSSLNGFEFPDLGDSRRRAIIQELCHCEGWPFGLCRKAVLLPPLPKSPSESWSWRKGNRTIKMP